MLAVTDAALEHEAFSATELGRVLTRDCPRTSLPQWLKRQEFVRICHKSVIKILRAIALALEKGMEPTGFEPVTSSMPLRRSTN